MTFLEEDELLLFLSKKTRQHVSVTEQHLNEGRGALAARVKWRKTKIHNFQTLIYAVMLDGTFKMHHQINNS